MYPKDGVHVLGRLLHCTSIGIACRVGCRVLCKTMALTVKIVNIGPHDKGFLSGLRVAL